MLLTANFDLACIQVFFRAGTVASLENRKEQSSESRLVGFQAHCRGYLARRIVKKNQVGRRTLILLSGAYEMTTRS